MVYKLVSKAKNKTGRIIKGNPLPESDYYLVYSKNTILSPQKSHINLGAEGERN